MLQKEVDDFEDCVDPWTKLRGLKVSVHNPCFYAKQILQWNTYKNKLLEFFSSKHC